MPYLKYRIPDEQNNLSNNETKIHILRETSETVVGVFTATTEGSALNE